MIIISHNVHWVGILLSSVRGIHLKIGIKGLVQVSDGGQFSPETWTSPYLLEALSKLLLSNI